MRSGPALHHHLPARRAGSFGLSPMGRVAEGITLTWFRFEVFLLWLAFVFGCLLMLTNNVSTGLLAFLLSPMMALALWVVFKLTGWLFYFVPGISTRDPGGMPDVIRGEETQVLGASKGGTEHFVTPGTHSKWITVNDREITGFSSYMTGEVVSVSSQHP